jgi:cyclopropane-fatty-acyl-phospholipid synthase
VGRLRLRVVFPDRATLGAGGPDAPAMLLHRPEALFRRVGAAGLVGFGEAYQAGDWDCDDLPGLLAIFARDVATLVPPKLQWLRRFHGPRHPRPDENTMAGSRRNIHRHYDLSNDLFALFLDETMTYSSAMFAIGAEGAPDPSDANLAGAQRRKVDRILDLTRVGPGTRLLEIGTGWGELALRAAQRGATVDTVTISREQAELARTRVREAGLADQVRVDLRDYREVTAPAGGYDAVVSVEMIEAVGERYWPVFFSTVDRVLAPGGRFGLQAITMPHKRLLATRRTYTWMHKYIFPGGLIPSVTAIEETCRRHTRLRVAERFSFGRHYAKTLRQWREGFTQRAADVAALGFDETFRRTWNLYLAYCEAGFTVDYLDVQQLALDRSA